MKTPRFLTRLAIVGSLLAGATSVACASAIVVPFDTSIGTAIPGSAPYGAVTFTLNANGTIGVNVTAEAGLLITWFLFNEPAGATSSAITPAPVYVGTQLASGFGDAGFGVCFGGSDCFTDFLTDEFNGEAAPFGTPKLSFTLSTPGGFTSLSNLVNANVPIAGDVPDNTFGVSLINANGQEYGAIGTASAPEPSTFRLLGAALLGFLVFLGTRRYFIRA